MRLTDAFVDYLSSDLAPHEGSRMADALDAAGLGDLARGIRLDQEGRSETESWRVDAGPWQGRSCRAGRKPSRTSSPGELWIDTVELSTMILVPHPDDPRRERQSWLATHPAWVWQFAAFRRLVNLAGEYTELPLPDDYLEEERFEVQNESRFVTELYQDEALGYAHWFQKTLAGPYAYCGARALLGDALTASAFGGLRVWDEADPADESLRAAYGADNFDRPLADDFAELEKPGYANRPDRVLYEEWETAPTIGVACQIIGPDGLFPAEHKSRTRFVRFGNAAPRPSR